MTFLQNTAELPNIRTTTNLARHLKAIFSVQVLTHNKEDKTHSGRMETKQKTFGCSQCDYKSTTAGNLKAHERTHTGDKPFSCSQCEYKCSTSGHLKKHERTHTGEKPFSCSQCDYKCSDSSALKSHERIHTGEKPFSCSQCDYKCLTSSDLKKHQRIHTGDKYRWAVNRTVVNFDWNAVRAVNWMTEKWLKKNW